MHRVSNEAPPDYNPFAEDILCNTFWVSDNGANWSFGLRTVRTYLNAELSQLQEMRTWPGLCFLWKHASWQAPSIWEICYNPYQLQLLNVPALLVPRSKEPDSTDILFS